MGGGWEGRKEGGGGRLIKDYSGVETNKFLGKKIPTTEKLPAIYHI